MNRLGCSLWKAGDRQRGKHPPRDPLISRYVPSSGLLFSLWTQHMSVDHPLDAEFASRPLQMTLARGPFPSVTWGNEEGNNNLSKLWTDYIHEHISAFNAVLTTESIRREKWGWGVLLSSLRGLTPTGSTRGRIWIMALASPVWFSNLRSVSTNSWQGTASSSTCGACRPETGTQRVSQPSSSQLMLHYRLELLCLLSNSPELVKKKVWWPWKESWEKLKIESGMQWWFKQTVWVNLTYIQYRSQKNWCMELSASAWTRINTAQV